MDVDDEEDDDSMMEVPNLRGPPAPWTLTPIGDTKVFIKQITTEICDVKERNKPKKVYSGTRSTSTHNRNENGPLQEYHGEHDKDGTHYKGNVELQPSSNYNQEHCAPTPLSLEEGPTSSPLPPPEPHPSGPDNGTQLRPPSKTSPWLTCQTLSCHWRVRYTPLA